VGSGEWAKIDQSVHSATDYFQVNWNAGEGAFEKRVQCGVHGKGEEERVLWARDPYGVADGGPDAESHNCAHKIPDLESDEGAQRVSDSSAYIRAN